MHAPELDAHGGSFLSYDRFRGIFENYTRHCLDTFIVSQMYNKVNRATARQG